MKTQFVTDHQGKKVAVILPIKDYRELIESLEEAEDIRRYDEVKARKEEAMPFSEYLERRRQTR